MYSPILPAGMLLLACASASAAWAADVAAPGGATAPVTAAAAKLPVDELTWQLDPYASSVGLNIPLGDKPIPTIQSDDYGTIFRGLMEDSLLPHYMQLQALVYPVPVLATYLNTHTPRIWDLGQVGTGGINLLESSSTHYQDPWAVSAFFGNIADLALPHRPQDNNDVGYAGWLLSAGAQRLKDNMLVQDKWYDVEWQIRGDLKGPEEHLEWNFRVGSRFNANPYVTDVTYIGIERQNLDLNQPFLGWLNNSHFDLELSFSHDGGRVVREQLIFGKKYPFPDKGYAITLDTGIVWDSPYEYSGPLRDTNKGALTLVFQPSIEF